MTILNDDLADLNDRCAERKETILRLLVPIVGAVATDGKPVFTPARAVARAVAAADALERRLDKERGAELDELIAAHKGDATDEAAIEPEEPDAPAPTEYGSKAWVVG